MHEDKSGVGIFGGIFYLCIVAVIIGFLIACFMELPHAHSNL